MTEESPEAVGDVPEAVEVPEAVGDILPPLQEPCKGNLGRRSTLRQRTGKGESKVRYKSALHT